MFEIIFVWIIVGGALVLLVRRLRNAVGGKNSTCGGCGTGCSACSGYFQSDTGCQAENLHHSPPDNSKEKTMNIIRSSFMFIICFCFTLSLAIPARAATDLERKLQSLAAQLQALQNQLQAQKQEIETYQQTINRHRRDIESNNRHLKKQEEILAKSRKEQETLSQLAEKLKVINEHVTLSGLVEVEAFKTAGYDGEDESDITLARSMSMKVTSISATPNFSRSTFRSANSTFPSATSNRT
ncbi:MAG: hypothetical protein JRJ56_05470 [Deltaproteobacteria bacterium]|nr:hypothetical protein [Deltaproteobacteria bacterium]